MRKSGLHKIIMAALIMVMITMLSACGQVPANQTAQPAQEGAADKSEFITYQAFNGEVKIPKDPKRAVIIADSYVGHFLTLGIKPIGITDHAMGNPYFKGKLDGIESVGDGTSLEKVLAMNPDLLIVFEGDKNIEQFTKIAPTVVIPFGKKPIREELREFGKMTGKEDKANEWIAEWDKKIAEAKPKVQAAVGDQTVSILQPYAKGIYAFGHNFGRGGDILYGEFQLKAPNAVKKEAIDSNTGYAEVSLETLPDFAGDYIFTSAWTEDVDPETVYGTSVWKGLPAVKNNKVFQIDQKGAFFNDPISLEAQLTFIVEKLT
ncbi:iron-hydroxamate ABC transporter substrate-binding protein [Brevibacillus sp. 179-C9.3 HS]|uniref:iron-hydroxamate ABC transporter substrate-binding protein n=1 Tax=unclassified Brevibacillus TaxID=2684853 RepID=UPI0039A17C8F